MSTKSSPQLRLRESSLMDSVADTNPDPSDSIMTQLVNEQESNSAEPLYNKNSSMTNRKSVLPQASPFTTSNKASLPSSFTLNKSSSDRTSTVLSGYFQKEEWTDRRKKVMVLVIIVALVTRFYNLSSPEFVIFDEIHMNNYVSCYLRESYFFDMLPPLGKLFFAAMGALVNYNGQTEFTNIGQDYLGPRVPYIAFRSVSAIFGSMTIALVFALMTELNLSLLATVITCTLLVFDNALLTQSRVMMVDVTLYFFIIASAYCWVRFSKYRHCSYSLPWKSWLALTGFFIGCCISTKCAGILTWLFILFVSGFSCLYSKKFKWKNFGLDLSYRFIFLILVPILIYLTTIWVHLSILKNSGPGDIYMSLDFQKSLHGNSLLADQSQVIRFGHIVRIRSKLENTYLHSHLATYPLKHEDGKVSSAGQQISGYPSAWDPKNLWVIERPLEGLLFNDQGQVNNTELLFQTAERNGTLDSSSIPSLHHDEGNTSSNALPASSDTLRTTMNNASIADEQVIRLKHWQTGKYLLTHDVASASTKTNTEFTAVNETQLISQYNNSLFRLQLVFTTSVKSPSHPPSFSEPYKEPFLASHVVHFRLVHVPLGVKMTNPRQNYPKWGFHQREVNGDKLILDDSSQWLIDFIHDPSDSGNQEGDILSRISNSEAKTDEETAYSMWDKLYEYLWLYGKAIMQASSTHPYASHPVSWPFMIKGVSMWDSFTSKRQIYLLGNPIIWLIAFISLITYGWVFLNMRWKRNIPFLPSITEYAKYKLFGSTGFLVAGYLFHYVPYALGFGLGGNMAFLSSYIPAFLFNIAITGSLLDVYLRTELGKPSQGLQYWKSRFIIFLALVLVLATFLYFAPITCYPSYLTTREGEGRRWLPSWHFLVTLHPH